MSTPQTGGERRPSTRKPSAGAKPTTAGPSETVKPASGTSDSASSSSARTRSSSSSGAKSASSGTKSASSGTKSAASKPAAKAAPAKKAGTARTVPARAAARAAAAKSTPARSSGGKSGGRPPLGPVKVSSGRNWGPIVLFTVVALAAAGIIGFGVYEVYQNGRGWEDKANSISGIVDYRKTDPAMLTRNHKYGPLQYKVNPPVGGDHNPNWMQCDGHVYTAQIPNENAVHSLEHGAVWITYRPDLPTAQVNQLKAKVTGNDFMLMSPYPGLSAPITLQAWGYQLKVNDAGDKRIDEFIKDLRQNAAMEPNTPCSTGNYVTGTGTTPYDLGSPAASAPASAAPSAAATGTPSAAKS